MDSLWVWAIIMLSLLAHILNCPVKNPSWDISACVSMGKYIYSLGKAGLWEGFRPIIYPAILGFFWKIGGDPILWTSILDICFGLGSIYLVYLIGKAVFNYKTAIICALFMAFSPAYFILTDTRIASTFFALIAVYLLLKNRFLFSGILMAVAFLTNFSQLFTFISIFLAVSCYPPYLKKENLLKIGKSALGFAAVITPFLIFNAIINKDFLHPFILSGKILYTYSFMSHKSPLYYLKYLLTQENFCLAFYLIGAIFAVKPDSHRNIGKPVILFAGVISLIFLYAIDTKHPRYLIPVIPYLYMISAYGIAETLGRLNIKLRALKLLLYGLIAVSVLSGYLNVINADTEPIRLDIFQRYVQRNEGRLKGNIWISNPSMLVYSNLRAAQLIYYPVFDLRRARQLRRDLGSADVILFSDNDFPCLRPDSGGECVAEKKKLIEEVASKFKPEVYLIDKNNRFRGGIFKR